MKHLKTYQIFELAPHFEPNMDSYTKLVKEICYELEDEGYNVDIKSELEVPSWVKDYIKKGHNVSYRERILDITISKKGWFVYNDVRDTCERLIEVLGYSKYWSDVSVKPMTLEDTLITHYWPSSTKGERMILFPMSAAMNVKKKNSDVIPSGPYLGWRTGSPTEKDCLKSEVVLKFR